MYKRGLRKTQVARFGLMGHVNQIARHAQSWSIRKESRLFFDQETESIGRDHLRCDLLELVVRILADPEEHSDPLMVKGCHFHDHASGSPCSKAPA